MNYQTAYSAPQIARRSMFESLYALERFVFLSWSTFISHYPSSMGRKEHPHDYQQRSSVSYFDLTDTECEIDRIFQLVLGAIHTDARVYKYNRSDIRDANFSIFQRTESGLMCIIVWWAPHTCYKLADPSCRLCRLLLCDETTYSY